jgi:hypothetical protein
VGRSFFSIGFRGDHFLGTQSMATIVGTPVLLNLTYDQVRAAKWKPLREVRQPAGYVTVFPFVVKLADGSGEFLVYADGTASWTLYASGHMSAPFRIK